MASEVDDAFWREFRRRVKAVDPDALLIGEVWESAGHWLDGSMFDSAMNYELRRHCRRFFAEMSEDAYTFSGRCTDMLMRYRKQLVAAQARRAGQPRRGAASSPSAGATSGGTASPCSFRCAFPACPACSTATSWASRAYSRPTTAAPCPGRAGTLRASRSTSAPIALRRTLAPLQRGGVPRPRRPAGLRPLRLRAGVWRRARERGAQLLGEGRKLRARGEMLWSEGLAGGKIGPYGFAVSIERG